MSEPQVNVAPTQEPPEPPPVRIWTRLALFVLVVVVALIIAGAIGTSLSGHRAASERKSLEAQLDASDPNWRLADLERAREEIPDHENSARVVMQVHALLPKNWPNEKTHELFQNLAPNERLDPERARRLEEELTAAGVGLELADRLADMPRGRHRLVWTHNPLATLLPDQQHTRAIATLLNFDAMNRGQKGDVEGALRSCRSIVNAGRSLGDEPMLISALIRCAILAIAGNATERALAQGVGSDKELARLQQLLELEVQHQTLRVAVRGERAMSYDLMTKMQDGRINTQETLGLLREGGEHSDWLLMLGYRRIGAREPGQCLKLLTKVVESTELPEAEQRLAELQYDKEAKAIGNDAPYVRMLAPAVTNASRSIRRKTALVRCLLVLVAAERYRLKHDRWPDDLAALKPGLLAQIPTDPHDGKPLRYLKRPDGVTVYSIGEDGIDNGGKVNRNRPMEKGVDQGYHLWDVGGRGQTPPPKAEAEKVGD